MNNDPTPLVQTSGALSLYEQTKITRNGITIFKRYAPPHDSYYFRFAMRGRRVQRKLLRTAEDSFRIARRLLDEVEAGRFAAIDSTSSRQPSCATIGQVLAHYEAHAAIARGLQPRTVSGNIGSLRLILRKTLRVADAQADALPASVLTRDLLEKCKAATLAPAGTDQLKKRTAAITANSTIRQARSLFAKKLGPDFYAGLVLPDLSKFMAVQLLPVEIKRFRMPPEDLLPKLRAYAPLLKKTDPEAYKIYLLSMGAGLRKGEIAHARLRWIERSGDVAGIRVQTEADFHIKDNEERCVPLDPFLLQELTELLAGRQPGDYILSGLMTERTDNVFRRFSAWLKTMGWERRLKCHEMRKIFGSLVTAQAGIRAAQVLLGHSQITTTENYYADPSSSIKNVVIFKPDSAAA